MNSPQSINKDNISHQQFKKNNLYTMFITNVLHGFGFSMFNVVFQPYLYYITQSEVILGYLVTFGMLMQLIPMQLSGKLADKYGRKPLILVGLSFFGIGLMILAFFQELVLVIIGILFVFSGYGIKDPPSQILTRENSPEKKHGLMFSLMFFGYFAGSIGGNLIVTALGAAYTAVFYLKIFAVIILMQFIIQFFFLKEKGVEKNSEPESKPESEPRTEAELKHQFADKLNKSKKSWQILFKNSRNRKIIIFFLFDSMIWGISLSIYNGALVANYAITKEQIGLILLTFNISNMIFQIPCGHLIDKIGKRWGIFLGDALGIIFYALNLLGWIFRDHYLLTFLLIANFIFGIIVSLFLPAQLSLLSSLNEKKPTEFYGIMNMVLGFGFMPMGLLSGLLIASTHYIVPFIISISLIPLELIYIIKIFPRD